MRFLGVGLGEVTAKGDEPVAFHFGGSTCCFIFQPGPMVAPIDQDGNDLLGSKVWVGKDVILTVT